MHTGYSCRHVGTTPPRGLGTAFLPVTAGRIDVKCSLMMSAADGQEQRRQLADPGSYSVRAACLLGQLLVYGGLVVKFGTE